MATSTPDQAASSHDPYRRVTDILQRLSPGRMRIAFLFDAGVDRSYVGGLERGEENPTVDTLEKLCTTLGAKLTELFDEPQAGATPPEPLKAGRKAR